MEQMTELTKKVLEFLEPDTSKWEYWITQQSLNPVSESKCMERFKERISQAVSNCEKVIVAGDYDCGATRS
ncbi:hypothetical protein [uncultured Holdemanella sp.]|uniref:hypothetical protein n=1 Tax=uncultured Holdemanella sp. TaxID=1763549 RepID=UPI0011C117FB|nr:hypothetical protein [uncultured Holdemanella sp.]